MQSNEETNKLRNQVDQWEYELYELSGRAQEEVAKAGQIVRKKYDGRIQELRKNVDSAMRKLKNQ